MNFKLWSSNDYWQQNETWKLWHQVCLIIPYRSSPPLFPPPVWKAAGLLFSLSLSLHLGVFWSLEFTPSLWWESAESVFNESTYYSRLPGRPGGDVINGSEMKPRSHTHRHTNPPVCFLSVSSCQKIFLCGIWRHLIPGSSSTDKSLPWESDNHWLLKKRGFVFGWVRRRGSSSFVKNILHTHRLFSGFHQTQCPNTSSSKSLVCFSKDGWCYTHMCQQVM